MARQLRLLNTNSRFHYELIVARLGARRGALAPDGLDAVFWVASGSEANDLALRLVRCATRPARRDRDPERVPRLDAGHRRDLDRALRQPAGGRAAAAVDPPGREPEHLSRRPSRRRRRGALRRRRDARAGGPGGGGHRPGRLHRRDRSTATPAACSLPDGYLQRRLRGGARGRRPLHRRRGAGRLRPAGRALLGVRAAGRRARRDHDRQGDRQRLPGRRRHHDARDRRGVRRGRARSSPRPAAARPAARRRSRCSTCSRTSSCRRTPCRVGDHLRARLEALDRAATRCAARCTAWASTSVWSWCATARRSSPRPRRRTPSASGMRELGVIVAADLRRHERAQDQAAALPHRGVRRLLRRHARPRADDRLVARLVQALAAGVPRGALGVVRRRRRSRRPAASAGSRPRWAARRGRRAAPGSTGRSARTPSSTACTPARSSTRMPSFGALPSTALRREQRRRRRSASRGR